MTVSELRKVCEIGEALGHGDSYVCIKDNGDSHSEQQLAHADYERADSGYSVEGEKFVLEITYANL
jgi:hypothetical protein